MGIRKQNVKTLFKTKNLETIYKASEVLGVPFMMLVGYIEEPDPIPLDAQFVDDGITHDDIVISEEDIPTGNSTEDINIRSVSLDETAGQASITYLSTLAVLQLDAILTNAWLVKNVPSKQNSKNQRSFERMLIMEYFCTGVGRVKMTVGVRRKDKMKVHYCITAIEAKKTKQEAIRPPAKFAPRLRGGITSRARASRAGTFARLDYPSVSRCYCLVAKLMTNFLTNMKQYKYPDASVPRARSRHEK